MYSSMAATSSITITVIGVMEGLANSPWPMGLHDLQHTGRSQYNGPSSPVLQWRYTAGGAVMGPSIGSDGTIYVGSWDNKLHAITSGGDFKWSFTTGNWVQSYPAIAADGTVIFGSLDGKLYAVNKNGSLKRTYTTGGIVNTSPAIGRDGQGDRGCNRPLNSTIKTVIKMG
jgi:outer membrane protein assembly factor BamB